MSRPTIRSTDRTDVLAIDLPTPLTQQAFLPVLEQAVSELGLTISHTTVLGRRKYPGNVHWHFKRDPREKGCLDATYWPGGPVFWVAMRKMEPDWVRERGQALHDRMQSGLADCT